MFTLGQSITISFETTQCMNCCGLRNSKKNTMCGVFIGKRVPLSS